MKYQSAFVYSLLALVAQGQVQPKPQGPLIPAIETEQDFLNFSLELEEAVRGIELSMNSSSRSGLADTGVGNKMQTILSGFFQKAGEVLPCKGCKLAVSAAARVSRLPFTETPMVWALKKLCNRSSGQTPLVCDGVIESSGPLAYQIFRNLNLDDDNTHPMVCHSFGDICPMPEVKVKPLQFSKKVTLKEAQNIKKEKNKFIVQFTDLHYDREYKEGSEADCDKPICCQPDSSDEKDPKKFKRRAGKWGDYKCDNNRLLTEGLMQSIQEMDKKLHFDMAIFSGDVPAHDMWKEEVERVKKTESESFRMIDSHINPTKTKIYPVIGNHESVPLNSFPLDNKLGSKTFFLYKYFSTQWKSWLPSQALQSIVKGGYYSVQHNKNLKVITLNNNLCYKLNLYLLLEPSNSDPNGMFKWLVNELDSAEKSGSKVYLSGHVPSGSIDCYHHWSQTYASIVERYSHIISAQFYGHMHTDEFQMFYNSSKDKSQNTAISHAYLAPSLTTFGGMNPGFRVYEVDSTNYQVVNYIQYYADLKQAASWKTKPDVQILYDARSQYGNNVSTDKMPYLDSKFWHNVTDNLTKDRKAFDKFYNFRTKNANTSPKCDESCRNDLICSLKATKSKENCLKFTSFQES